MNALKLTFVNVGYGEAALLECPDPSHEGGVFTMLIDGGSANASEYADRSSGRIPLVEWLSKQGCTHLDCVLVTHIHEDHICGLLPCVKKWMTGKLLTTCPQDLSDEFRPIDPAIAQNLSQKNFLAAINDYRVLCGMVPRERICRVGAGDEGTFCPRLAYRFLAPNREQVERMTAGFRTISRAEGTEDILAAMDELDHQLNNFSAILRLEYQSMRILLPGDTNCHGFGGIDPAELKADLFKVGHHGQKDGVDAALMDIVKPSVTVCCASSDRRYNSAWPDTMAMLSSRSKLYFTDTPPVEVDQAPPHEALEFTICGGKITAKYLR